MSERDSRPDEPPTEEEIAASRRLRDALEDASISDPDAELARSLRAAYAPSALSREEHEEILADVPTAEEIAAAADTMRDPIVEALRAAWSPRELPAEEHRAIVARALEGGKVVAFRRRTTLVRVAFATTVLAAAAAVLVYVGRPPNEAPIARSRSTQPLFSEPFKSGEASARIDRIAIARAADHRDNRFAKWGVR